MSSSTSSTEENKDENNDQTNNNIAKNDNSMNFLEEVPPTTAPPPSYEDVVKKPQPTLPSYSQHNDSPPPFPQPAENYNQTIIYPSPSNSNSKRREYRGCCCCNSSRNSRNKNCGCGWIIVLIVFIILTTISVANNNACNNITLGPNSENFSFDPTNTIFKINTDKARIKGGQVKIFYQQQTQQVVNVQVSTGANGVTPKFGTSNQNGVYELKISQKSGFSIFNIPPRCMRVQVNVFLPYLTTAVPNTIQVKDLNLIMSDNVYPYQQKITLTTEDGNILLNGVTFQNDIVLETKDGLVLFNNTVASNISVTTNDGDIHGSITSISNGFSALTDSGDLGLHLGIASGVNNAKIKIQTNDGNVDLKFTNSSFSGSYNILSRDGRIITGNHNDGGNDLNISAGDGNVNVEF